ncbi:YVTN family beta-propeller repeat protein [Luteimonas sp. e5]
MNRLLLVPVLLLALGACTSLPATETGELLVGNKSADTVWRLSLADGRKLGEFPTGHQPHEIAVSADGGRIVVSNYADHARGNSLSVIDRGAAPRSVPLGEKRRPHGIAFIPGSRSELLVSAEGTGSLLRVDLDAGQVTADIDVGEGIGHMLAVSPDGRTTYVSKIRAGTVVRVDLDTARKTHEVASGAGAEGIAVHPHSGEVWVGNRADDSVTIHDPDTLELRARLPSTGFPIRVAFTADGRHALVTNARAARLAVFDVAQRRQVADVRIDEDGAQYGKSLLGDTALPIGVIVDPQRPRAYVAISGGDEVAVVDTARWQVIDRWPTGKEPDALGIVR